MVKLAPDRVIQPASNCTSCRYRFREGDKAWSIVALPSGDHDTLCVECWAITLSAAVIELKRTGNLSETACKRLCRRALALVAAKGDWLPVWAAPAEKQTLSTDQTY